MFTNEQLDESFKSASYAIQNAKGFDTLVFRKGFEDETSLTDDDRKQILGYLKGTVNRSDALYVRAKECIDQSESSSDYFHNYPRRFRGAYYKVVLRFIAAIMTDSLYRNINTAHL